jgi:hypothetical protein
MITDSFQIAVHICGRMTYAWAKGLAVGPGAA